jgi:hypothetical protein
MKTAEYWNQDAGPVTTVIILLQLLALLVCWAHC